MSEYDAIVVGAGPGGSSAAYYLAGAGARVLVLERKAFPRAKVCGDGLTPRAVRVLVDMGMAAELDTYHRVKGLRLVGLGHRLDLDFPATASYPDYGLVRPRKDLDADIAARAQAAGAELLMRTEAVAPVLEGSRVVGVRWVRKEPAEGGGVVKVDEGVARAPFTIISDGSGSPFGRAVGIRRRPEYPLGLAIRTYYVNDRHDDDFFEAWLPLKYEGVTLPGYGWLFPVGDGTINIGAGILNTYGRWREVNLNRLQRTFIDSLAGPYGITHEDQVGPYKSSRLPLAGSARRPYGDGYLVIGDAAGMVNPFSGEGIAYALETAKLAAGLVTEALAGGDGTELAHYRDALHDTYGGFFRMGRSFARAIGNPRLYLLLAMIGMNSRRLMQFLFEFGAFLVEPAGGRLSDRAFRTMLRAAQHRMPELTDVDLPSPKRLRPSAPPAPTGVSAGKAPGPDADGRVHASGESAASTDIPEPDGRAARARAAAAKEAGAR